MNNGFFSIPIIVFTVLGTIFVGAGYAIYKTNLSDKNFFSQVPDFEENIEETNTRSTTTDTDTETNITTTTETNSDPMEEIRTPTESSESGLTTITSKQSTSIQNTHTQTSSNQQTGSGSDDKHASSEIESEIQAEQNILQRQETIEAIEVFLNNPTISAAYYVLRTSEESSRLVTKRSIRCRQARDST